MAPLHQNLLGRPQYLPGLHLLTVCLCPITLTFLFSVKSLNNQMMDWHNNWSDIHGAHRMNPCGGLFSRTITNYLICGFE